MLAPSIARIVRPGASRAGLCGPAIRNSTRAKVTPAPIVIPRNRGSCRQAAGVAGDDDAQPAAMVLHQLQRRVHRLTAKVRPAGGALVRL
jgi:hypothetical protein